MYGHASIGNKFIGGAVTSFALAGFIEYTTVVMIDSEHAFAATEL